MSKLQPESCDFLAVVSEWSSYAKSGNSSVGNAYPIFNLTELRTVQNS
jgi:hypothetical protein